MRERRRFGRTSQPIELRYRLRGELVSPWTQTATVNLSASGVRFKCQEPLRTDDELDLRLQLTGAPKPLEFLVRVVWSQMQASGVTEFGAEFLNVTDQQQVQIDELVQFLGKDRFVLPPE